jgi:hypothetical protein
MTALPGYSAMQSGLEEVERLWADDAHEIVVSQSAGALPRIDEVDLFNRPEFFALHAPAFRWAGYFLARHATTLRPLAVCHVAETAPGQYRSPGRGSFGSVALLRDVELPVVERLVEHMTRHLGTLGARSLALVLPPMEYHPADDAIVTNVLLRAGFTVSGHELNYALEVGAAPFVDGIDRGNRKRMNAAVREGLTFEILPAEQLADAYGVIAANRAKKGYPLSMSLDALQTMADRIPGAVRCFGVRNRGELIAAAICIVVNPVTLYVFYWGDVPGVESLSPVTPLAAGLYEYCQREGFRQLDIGTSTLAGVPNHGLIRYKKNLGCRPSLKLTLSLSFPAEAR